MNITMEDIEKLRKKMKEAPAIENSKRKISKQEAINELKREIEDMQKRGYKLDDISKFFGDSGLVISTATLKSYMQRAKAVNKKVSKINTVQQKEHTQQQKKKSDINSAPAGEFKVRADSRDI